MGRIRDLLSNVTITLPLVPLLSGGTTDRTGTAVDMLGYERCTFVALFGAPGDTLSGSVYVTVELEESTDNSTWTDVADADVSTTVSGVTTGTICKVDANGEASLAYAATYIGLKRYVRPIVNLTGTHTNGTINAVLAIRHKSGVLPA
ncbi:hypothetical protein FJ251_08850 [bacterium]|nr:hypothetical protein [bacterium]